MLIHQVVKIRNSLYFGEAVSTWMPQVGPLWHQPPATLQGLQGLQLWWIMSLCINCCSAYSVPSSLMYHLMQQSILTAREWAFKCHLFQHL